MKLICTYCKSEIHVKHLHENYTNAPKMPRFEPDLVIFEVHIAGVVSDNPGQLSAEISSPRM